MARRRGRPGDWLATDDSTGFTVYASKLKRDFWGNLEVSPLKRNLQEIATALADPYPVYPIRGPQYETVASVSALVVAPTNVGVTSVPTNRTAPAIQAGVVE